MEMNKDRDLADLERRRLQLEENVSRLRQSLKHWQTWEAEYEGLKEEIEGFRGEPSTEEMIELGRDFGGDLVNEREIKELLGYGKGTNRTAKQVVELISRRMDYVQQNVRTVQKQLDAAEEKLNIVPSVTIPGLNNDEGLPLMEIQEELDEEGNVISGTVSNASRAAPQIVEALRKAGVKDLDVPEEDAQSSKSEETKIDSQRSRDEAQRHATTPDVSSEGTVCSTADHSNNKAVDSKKPLNAKEDVEPVHETVQSPGDTSRQGLGSLTRRVPEGIRGDIRGMFKPGDRVVELDENDMPIGSTVIPSDESPEDAQLRREMIQYGLNEVGAVVAELDLQETGSQDSEFEDEDVDEDDDYNEDVMDVDEDEDQYGRSTRREITDGYRKQMLELEKKLNARMLENVGPRPEAIQISEPLINDARRLVVRSDQDVARDIQKLPDYQNRPKGGDPKASVHTTADRPAKVAGKKGVRFAEDLDISPAPKPQSVKGEPPSKPAAEALSKSPVSEAIVERRGPTQMQEPDIGAPRKVSRFKSARGGQAVNVSHTNGASAEVQQNPTPTAENDQPARPVRENTAERVLSNNVKECAVSGRDVSAPDPDDGLDPALLEQEVAVQYHKMRNKMIQKQGGFMPSEEEVESPLMEERDGKIRKVSRFKAARLGASGT